MGWALGCAAERICGGYDGEPPCDGDTDLLKDDAGVNTALATCIWQGLKCRNRPGADKGGHKEPNLILIILAAILGIGALLFVSLLL
jgi:hypothetical protein